MKKPPICDNNCENIQKLGKIREIEKYVKKNEKWVKIFKKSIEIFFLS